MPCISLSSLPSLPLLETASPPYSTFVPTLGGPSSHEMRTGLLSTCLTTLAGLSLRSCI